MIKNVNTLVKIIDVNGYYFESGVAMDRFAEQKHLGRYKTRKVSAVVNAKKIKIVQEDGSIQFGYLFGEHLWSYDQEEINEYATAWHKEEAEKRERNRVMKQLTEKLNNLTTEELLALCERL